MDRQKVSAAGGDPTFAVGGETAAGNDAVQVRMEVQVLPPTMQDGEETEFQTEAFGRDDEQSLGGGAEENAVDDLLVVEGQRGDLLGEGEDHVEVLDGQQFGAAVLKPLLARDALALGAMAVAAGAIANVSELAVVAPFDSTAQ